MRDRSKLMAIAMVAMMLMSGVVVMTDGMDGAANNSEGFEEQELLLDGEDEPMLLGAEPLTFNPNATGQMERMYEGSWTWDKTTGLGPFNSFYGAFDINNGNAFVGVLDPYDLTKMIDGTPLPSSGKYNIMWILPTIYWSADSNGNLELSNDPTKGVAYAHTIDGHTYKYLAYGVYEGTNNGTNSSPKITSESGKVPYRDKSLSINRDGASFDLSAQLGTGAWSMLMNFYQWELYKYLGLCVMEDTDSQSTVGMGWTYSDNGSDITYKTGSTNQYGPYTGAIIPNYNDYNQATQHVRLFIEDAWGGAAERVDGAMIVDNDGVYVDTSHKPTESTTAGGFVTYYPFTNKLGTGAITAIHTSSELWGIPSTSQTQSSSPYYQKGFYDMGNRHGSESSTGSWIIGCGYAAGTSPNSVYENGINAMRVSGPSTSVGGFSGVRLTFVFDNDVASFSQSSYDYILEYDPTVVLDTSKSISVAGMTPISHFVNVTIESNDSSYGNVDETEVESNYLGTITVDGPTLTIGNITVTATPTTATEQYSYVFDGWYVGSAALTDGYLIEDNVTITAQFSQLEPVTVTLDAGAGSISETELVLTVGQPFGELPTPTPKGGYTFTGWYDPNGNRVTSETIVTETSDFTLTAHYELSDALKPVKALTDFIPILMIAGLIIAIIGTALYLKRDY